MPSRTTPAPADGELERPPLPERLSPSRMSEFLKCPKSFWYKSILRLPSAPTEATTRGTLTHTVLEELFAHHRDERTPETALAKILPAWEAMKAKPEYAAVVAVDNQDAHDLVDIAVTDRAPGPGGPGTVEPASAGLSDALVEIDPDKEAVLLASVEEMVRNYFLMERPQAFDASGLELRLTADIEGVAVHGIIDRLDTHESDAGVRVFVSDYKTGKPPSPRYLDDAFFAMKIYAVLVEEALGTPVHSLRLIYLKTGSPKGIYTLAVNETLNSVTRAKVKGIAQAIRRSWERDEWATKTGPLCNWCDFQSICPAFNPGADGVPIALEDRVVATRALTPPKRRR